MRDHTLSLFESTFGARAKAYAQAPGRLEILGNHTDYNEGFVLSTAIDRFTYIALRECEATTCRVISPGVEKSVRSFDLNELEERPQKKDWLNYVKGIVREFKKRDFEVRGFEAAILSSIPLSAGMSSSASLEVAIIKGLCELMDFEIDLQEMAKMGQGCENHTIGTNTGLMDQLTSLAGQKDCFVWSEYRNLEWKVVNVPKNLALVVFNSGVRHDLSQEYNERREQCETSLEILKTFYPEIQSLRDVSLEELKAQRPHFPDLFYRRALHVVEENERVSLAIESLEKKQTAEFLNLLFDSHRSSRKNFENSCAELDELVDLAQRSPSCYGARLSGGGFGGISIHLVDRSEAEAYQDWLKEAFEKVYGFVPEAFICQSAQGSLSEKI